MNLREFLPSGQQPQRGSVAIFEDIDVVVALASNNPICTSRTKHVNVRIHFHVCEKVEKDIMKFSHVTSACPSSVDSFRENFPAVTRESQEKFVGHVGLE